jgi:hypothetical protein
MIDVGQACAARSREASQAAVNRRLAQLPHVRDVQNFWDQAHAIPMAHREAWLHSESYTDYEADLESWLHKRAGNVVDDRTGEYNRPAPRLVSIQTKPPKGTRKRILVEIAARYSLTEKQVDNLWQEYCRFQRSLSDDV